MGQIANEKSVINRANIRQLSDTSANGLANYVPAAGEYILISSDNSMTSTGQGNFDSYIKGDGSHKASELEIKSRADMVPEFGGRNSVASAAVYPLYDALQDLDGDSLYVTDKQGNVIATINKDGIKSVEVEAGGKKLSLMAEVLDWYDDTLYVTDGNGNVIMKVDETGVHSINEKENQWNGKIIATYGDSVTALNGGDFTKPYASGAKTAKWAGKVADYFGFSALKNRGIGSTCFMWRSHGGQVAWVNTGTGVYVDRNDSYNYDNYEGHVTIPTGCTAIRGDGCSWLRITTMFPASIKDSIDVVLLQFHNDFHQDLNTEAQWVANSVVDPEWAASSYYSALGGDYNIDCVRGGIASTIMKLQAWMPQALLILMTPISGVYINGNENVRDLENTESAMMKTFAELVKEIGFRMSISVIDVYGNDGINSLNHSQFITDGIHPYNDAGCKKIARAVISGLNPMIPNL